MEPQEITEYLNRYVANENKKAEMDNSLLTIADKNEWVGAIEERAKEQRRMFTENNEIISAITSFLAEHPGCDFTPEQAEALYDGFYSIYSLSANGLYILSIFLDQLLAYYHSTKDYSRVVILSLAKFIVNVHHVRHYDKANKYNISEDLFTAVGYKAYYRMLTLEARRKVFFSYSNLCTSALQDEIDLSYFYLQEMFALWNSDIVPKEDREDPAISSAVSRVVKIWFEVFKKFDMPESNAVRYFKEQVSEMMKSYPDPGKKYEIEDYRLFRANNVVRCMNGEISPEDAVLEICEYYKARREINLAHSTDTDSIRSFIYIQQYCYDLIKNNKVDGTIIKPYVNLLIEDVLTNWGKIRNAFPPQYFDKYVSHVLVESIRYIDDDRNKEAILKKIVYQHHVSTSIHVNMVTKLSHLIANAILEEKPELFIGLWGYDLETVVSRKKDILDFVDKASYFHDIGKIGIVEIINQQTRKIMDTEFAIIKSHPSRGRDIAEMTIVLKQYSDVIEGHHKSYDGKTGYPASFDNTKSPVRAIIDLVTISDSIDAATDNLGRNYHIGKTSDNVLQEIVDGGGTRYNPYIADFIFSNANLREQIKHLTGEGRVDELYSIYHEYSLL